MTTVMLLAILGNLFLIFIIFRGNAVLRRRISPVQALNPCQEDFIFLQAICHPLQTYCSNRYRRPNYFATIAWITALICSTPQLFIWHKTKYGECATIYGHGVSLLKSIYVISFNTIAWLIPSMLAAFFYYRVCKTIWLSHRNQKLLLQMSDSSLVKNGCQKITSKFSNGFIFSQETKSYVVRLHNDSRHCRLQLMKFNRKRLQTICLTMTIIFCNFFLWAPFCVVNVLQAVVPHLLSSQLITYIVILGNLNSCVNPWIYIIFNKNQAKKAFTFTNGNLFTYLSRPKR
uniref:G_PROTEIN_RECEP_F1_2 domain-containing protein n=1 Tax=Elaeophora elaphi TaxID=1147741 RepID=A0A0R3RPB7_9BILA